MFLHTPRIEISNPWGAKEVFLAPQGSMHISKFNGVKPDELTSSGRLLLKINATPMNNMMNIRARKDPCASPWGHKEVFLVAPRFDIKG